MTNRKNNPKTGKQASLDEAPVPEEAKQTPTVEEAPDQTNPSETQDPDEEPVLSDAALQGLVAAVDSLGKTLDSVRDDVRSKIEQQGGALGFLHERIDEIESKQIESSGVINQRGAIIDPIGMTGSTIEFSEDVDALFPAILKFNELAPGTVAKDARNPFFNSRYATYGAVKQATHDALVKSGLFKISGRRPLGYQTIRQYDRDGRQWVEALCARVAITTTLIHAASGQWARVTSVFDSRDTGPQAMGTIDTYALRYNTNLLLDLAADDDDGNTGQGAGTRAAPAAPQGNGGRRQTAGERAQARSKADQPTGTPAAPPADVVAMATELGQDIYALVGEDAEAARSLLRELTSFTGKDGKPFAGYDSIQKIKSRAMVESARRNLREHPTFGAKYVELLEMRQEPSS